MTAIILAASLLLPAPLTAADGERVLRIGTQPLAIPTGVLLEALIREPEFQDYLKQSGRSVRVVPFRGGSEMIQALRDGELDGGVAGDGPVLIGAAERLLKVVSQVKLNFASLVSYRMDDLVDLRGGKIGYAPLSTAHFVALHALSSVNIAEQEVEWVQMPLSEMADALLAGRIDAFAGWEPAVFLSMHQHPELRILYRGISSSWLFLSSRTASETALMSVLGKVTASSIQRMQHPRMTHSALEHAQIRASQAGYDTHLLDNEHLPTLVTNGLNRIFDPHRIDDRLVQTGGRLAAYFDFMIARGTLAKHANLLMLQEAFAPMLAHQPGGTDR